MRVCDCYLKKFSDEPRHCNCPQTSTNAGPFDDQYILISYYFNRLRNYYQMMNGGKTDSNGETEFVPNPDGVKKILGEMFHLQRELTHIVECYEHYQFEKNPNYTP